MICARRTKSPSLGPAGFFYAHWFFGANAVMICRATFSVLDSITKSKLPEVRHVVSLDKETLCVSFQYCINANKICSRGRLQCSINIVNELGWHLINACTSPLPLWKVVLCIPLNAYPTHPLAIGALAFILPLVTNPYQALCFKPVTKIVPHFPCVACIK